jgi:hypothetical protein
VRITSTCTSWVLNPTTPRSPLAGDDRRRLRVDDVFRGGGRVRRCSGRELSLIAPRNHRPSPDAEILATRVSGGTAEWRITDGRIGYGPPDYLDQIIDGRPVGVDE